MMKHEEKIKLKQSVKDKAEQLADEVNDITFVCLGTTTMLKEVSELLDQCLDIVNNEILVDERPINECYRMDEEHLQ
jgi:hypothetical protein